MGPTPLAGLIVLTAACITLGCKARIDEQDDPSHTVVIGTAPSGTSAAPALPASAREPEGVLIPRSMADKGRYYLLERSQKNGIITAVHKRIGVDSVGWTRTQTNCRTNRMREMGYSEDGRDKIPHDPTRWFELIEGSSKSDLFRFLCKR